MKGRLFIRFSLLIGTLLVLLPQPGAYDFASLRFGSTRHMAIMPGRIFPSRAVVPALVYVAYLRPGCVGKGEEISNDVHAGTLEALAPSAGDVPGWFPSYSPMGAPWQVFGYESTIPIRLVFFPDRKGRGHLHSAGAAMERTAQRRYKLP